jgi:hypothetical protein
MRNARLTGWSIIIKCRSVPENKELPCRMNRRPQEGEWVWEVAWGREAAWVWEAAVAATANFAFNLPA